MLRLTREFYQRHSIPPEEAEAEVQRRQARLLAEAGVPQPPSGSTETVSETPDQNASTGPIWTRTSDSQPPSTAQRTRGPKLDTENHAKVVRIVGKYGSEWTKDEALLEICEDLDREGVPVPKPWHERKDGRARSWQRAVEQYPHLVIKAIKDRLKAQQRSGVSNGNSRQLPLLP